MNLKVRNSVLLAKQEVTYGVDASPTGAMNAMLVKNVQVNPLEQDAVQRDLVRPYMGNDEQIPVGTRISISFSVEYAGSGVAGQAPAYGPLLTACGLAETIEALTDVRYSPVSDQFKSDTLIYNMDGVSHKALGCRGSVAIQLDARGIPEYRFTFVGLYADVVDATVVDVDYAAFKKPLAVNKRNTPTATLFGQSVVLQSLSLDTALSVNYRNLVGYEGVDITDRAAKGKAVFQYTKVATYNWFADIKAANSGALSFIHGLVEGNIVELAAPNVQMINPSFTEDSGVSMLNVDLNYNPTDAGNDEFEIIVR